MLKENLAAFYYFTGGGLNSVGGLCERDDTVKELAST